jgi:CBS domain-containing protein
MKVEDIMTDSPITCMKDTSLQQVAKWMVDGDCGALPVVDSDNRPIGVITDRDITCRTVAKGKNPLELTVADAMTTPAATVYRDTPLDECLTLMEDTQVRRMVVLDDDGTVCGMVAQADLARHLQPEEAAELMRGISEETSAPSQIH